MKRALLILLSLLPLNLYAQGAGTPPYRGVNTFHLSWPSDNTFDIGASGATRPRTGYFGTSLITPALTVSGLTSGRVPVASTGGAITDFSTLAFSGGTLTATNLTATSGVTAASVTDSGLTSGRMTFATTGGLLTDVSTLTASAGVLTAAGLTASDLTATRMTFAGTSGRLVDDSDCAFATDTLTCTKLAGAIGSNTAPTYGFTGQNQTGIYSPSALQIGFTANGTYAARITAGGIGMTSAKQLSWCSDLACSVSVDAGLYRVAAGVIRCTDGGTTNAKCLLGGGAAVASTTALAVPAAGVYHVTGTTNITSITSTAMLSGVCITLIFDGVLTFTDGSNLVLAGNFVTTADDTIGLCYDGTNWYETHRSVN